MFMRTFLYKYEKRVIAEDVRTHICDIIDWACRENKFTTPRVYLAHGVRLETFTAIESKQRSTNKRSTVKYNLPVVIGTDTW